MSKIYNQTLSVVGDLTEGKTYYKDPTLCFPICPPLLNVTVNSISGSDVNVTFGNSPACTCKDTEVLLYINFMGGYSDTA